MKFLLGNSVTALEGNTRSSRDSVEVLMANLLNNCEDKTITIVVPYTSLSIIYIDLFKLRGT